MRMFYRDTTRTARKEHKCGICNGVISKGEKYHDKVGKYEGVFWSSKECEACQPVIAEFCRTDYADDEYCGGWIREWWRNEKCPACKRYTCKAGDTCDDMTHYCRCEKFEFTSEAEQKFSRKGAGNDV